MGSSDLAVPTQGEVAALREHDRRAAALLRQDQIVQDLDWLRRALGEKKLTLDGVSYGTFVASATRSATRRTSPGWCSIPSSRTRG